jgi:hypothetical protein
MVVVDWMLHSDADTALKEEEGTSPRIKTFRRQLHVLCNRYGTYQPSNYVPVPCKMYNLKW